MDSSASTIPPSADTPYRGPRLVPERVTQSKFDEQIDRWNANKDAYSRRGWLLLSKGELSVDVGFVNNVAMGGRTIPVMTACVRIDYWNFDLWPPSVTFLDPLMREPSPPPVRAPDRVSADEVRDALIDQHPTTLLPFLCLPGIREYHSHPQHSGDDWLLHRHLREGDLAVVCERIWRRMARNVLGMSVAIQSLAPAGGVNIANQLDITLLQGDPDLVQRQLGEIALAQLDPSALDARDSDAAGLGDAIPAGAREGSVSHESERELQIAESSGESGRPLQPEPDTCDEQKVDQHLAGDAPAKALAGAAGRSEPLRGPDTVH